MSTTQKGIFYVLLFLTILAYLTAHLLRHSKTLQLGECDTVHNATVHSFYAKFCQNLIYFRQNKDTKIELTMPYALYIALRQLLMDECLVHPCPYMSKTYYAKNVSLHVYRAGGSYSSCLLNATITMDCVEFLYLIKQ